MEENQLQAEKQHLSQTIRFIDQELAQADAQGEAQKEAIRALQEEHLESSRWETAGLHSIQGFAEMLEQSQEAQNLARMESARDNTLRMIRTLVRMRERPYFARIDFRFQDGRESAIYIGRATLMDKKTMKIQVYDWRVPIASVFYRYGVGPAQYEAPAGTIRGELILKRQYEIKQGELLYYFDANEEVLDSFLREMLGRPASANMKDIVETIQRDQDRVIRDMEAPLLMVQGSAGSGKTSVALHRVAYLMYQGLQQARLDPSHILILAPNATFERYIAQVLPGLGEEQVRTMLPEELLAAVLPKVRIQSRSAWVEGWLDAQGEEKRLLALCRGFKGSLSFVTLLERFLYELPRRWIPFADVDYDGHRVAWADLSRIELCQDRGRKAPLGARLRMLEKTVWERVHALRPARMEKLMEFTRRFPHHAQEAAAFARMLSIRESGLLLKELRAFTRVDCVALYRRLFADRDAFARLSQGLLSPEKAEALRLMTLEGLAGPEIPYEDAAAMSYLQMRVHGSRAFAHLRQVVADEAQDFDPLHAKLMGLLFPNARFTLLGDVHQTLRPGAGAAGGLGLYEKLAMALGKAPGLLVRLDKSFRCTREIWEFSARFLPAGAAGECFSRSGEKPRIHGVADKAALEELALRLIRESRDKGCQSIALVCKTARDAAHLYQNLKGQGAVALIGPEDAIRSPGVSILSLYRAKGLEFDAVLLYGVDAARYHDPADRSLLYIGCTRALHVLELLYAGEPSPMLNREEESL